LSDNYSPIILHKKKKKTALFWGEMDVICTEIQLIPNLASLIEKISQKDFKIKICIIKIRDFRI